MLPGFIPSLLGKDERNISPVDGDGFGCFVVLGNVFFPIYFGGKCSSELLFCQDDSYLWDMFLISATLRSIYFHGSSLLAFFFSK